jgi:hypothetical protein
MNMPMHIVAIVEIVGVIGSASCIWATFNPSILQDNKAHGSLSSTHQNTRTPELAIAVCMLRFPCNTHCRTDSLLVTSSQDLDLNGEIAGP